MIEQYIVIKEQVKMIIDVVDLDFKTLQFNRRYEPTRYKRGTNIYNKGLVEIENVNKIYEKNY